jgi:hypothetical protein
MKQKNRHKGRILRVKTGYNPNSSSVGSQIPAFLAFAAGSGVFTIIALHTLNVISRYIRKRKSSLNSQKTENENAV